MRFKALGFVFLFLTDLAQGWANAPVFRVDGLVVSQSPVIRGEQAQISMSTAFPNGSIFYTTDGGEPSGASIRYTSPFMINSSKVFRAIAFSLDFSQSAQSGPVEVRIVPLVVLGVVNNGGGSLALNPQPYRVDPNWRYLSNTLVQETA